MQPRQSIRSIGRVLLIVLAVVLAGSTASLYAQSAQTLELRNNWKLIAADHVKDSGAEISQPGYPVAKWHVVRQMPATVLGALQADGVYPNLYYGMNLLTEVPQNLWKHKWWYRTTFSVPAGSHTFWLDFPGINYRADIWLNGKLVANDHQVVGMYIDHRFNVTQFIKPGAENTLAVKVTPEQKIRDVNGVELADSWQDWINWKYLGYHGPLDARDFSTRSLTATYTTATGAQPASPVTATIEVTAASTSETTLEAEVTSGGTPVKSGSVTFTQYGHSLGSASVNTKGIATLTVPQSTETLLASGGISFVPDRNAGIWKPVFLHITGPVKISNALVDTTLPLPKLNPAQLTVYATLTNGTASPVSGQIEAEITRAGKPSIHLAQTVSLRAGETRNISFTPAAFPQLVVHNPALWWPYTMGKPALYNLQLQFVTHHEISDTEKIRFGIREVTQHRDHDAQFGPGGNFYLQINGRNFLVRGAAYTPDLLYQYNPRREKTMILYAKDLGLNMLRSEGKIASEHMVEVADEEGMPLMYGWMCCNQWEHWKQWSPEDYRVADQSLRSVILMLRSHPSVFLWANGSDGRPPARVRASYHRILKNLHWQNAVVDTVSSQARSADGKILWDGIQMPGPYSWRPPSYWFAEKYAGAAGSIAEEGSNENIPPYESLKKFIPPNHLWPINKYWYFHAGASAGNNHLLTIQRAVNRRYGPSTSAEEFSFKAQAAEYENVRAQFEDFAANGWATHKMTIYWMFDNQWPSFFGHLFDYYLKPGGAYYGAKKGLRPLSVVFDYFATGDHSHAHFTVVNQTPTNQHGLRARIRIYDLTGKLRDDWTIPNITVASGGVAHILIIAKPAHITPVYFVRCDLFNAQGKLLVDNVYWQATKGDDLGGPKNDADGFNLQMAQWADMKSLNTMPRVRLNISAHATRANGRNAVTIQLQNPTSHIAFFERATVTHTKDGDEILPIEYSDNYVTVFPHETTTIHATLLNTTETPAWVRLRGYNTAEETVPIQ